MDLGAAGTSAAGVSDAYDNMQSDGMWDDDGDETNQQRDEMVRSTEFIRAAHARRVFIRRASMYHEASGQP